MAKFLSNLKAHIIGSRINGLATRQTVRTKESFAQLSKNLV